MEKIIQEAYYIINNDATIRDTAKYFGVSKSVLHRHMNGVLKNSNYNLYIQVKNVFLEHTKVRHIRGGEATKKKYTGG